MFYLMPNVADVLRTRAIKYKRELTFYWNVNLLIEIWRAQPITLIWWHLQLDLFWYFFVSTIRGSSWTFKANSGYKASKFGEIHSLFLPFMIYVNLKSIFSLVKTEFWEYLRPSVRRIEKSSCFSTSSVLKMHNFHLFYKGIDGPGIQQ